MASGSPSSPIEQCAELLGSPIVRSIPLSGGCIADVRLLELKSGRRVVAKVGGPALDIEGRMLEHLRRHSTLPVPHVLHAAPKLLLLEYIEHRGGSGWGAHLADLLAELHSRASSDDRFGFDEPTLIGPLRLENGRERSWAKFYRDNRLLPVLDEASCRGRLPSALDTRLRVFAGRLEDELDHSPRPSLVHGDVWSGNVLASGNRVLALIDPSVVYADAEFELAFIEMFSTGGHDFFDRYHALRPIDCSFFERRVFIYQLFPLLVHVTLFGGGYVSQLDSVLSRLER